jgi:flavin-dependent dehydrogenase
MVKSIKKENSGFSVEGDGFSFRSKYLLCADGVNGHSAKLLGFRDKWKRDEVALCIESEVTGHKPPKSPASFYFGGVKWGYAWFFDKGTHASIGIGTVLKDASNLRQLFDSFIENCGYVNSKENLKMNAWRIPMTGGISGNFVNGNALLIGDAAGLVDPFLGEGIFYAIKSGKIAAECVINDRICDYNKRIDKEITSNLKYARILAKIVKLSPKRFIKLLSNDKTIAIDWVEIVYGNLTYKQFLINASKKILLNPLKLI